MNFPADGAALFMLGLLGTGHCIGMCGPLVVAIPGQSGRFSAHLAYHAGRVLTYGVIGVLMGAAGSGLVHLAVIAGDDPLLWVSRVQVGISAFAGFFLLFFGLSRMGLVREPDWLAIAMPNRLPGWRRLTVLPASERGNADFFLTGMLLGFLPCGLSYAAFARALSSADPLIGGCMALIFGTGTLPGLLAVGVGAAMLFSRFRRQSDLLAGLVMLAMAADLLVKAGETIWR